MTKMRSLKEALFYRALGKAVTQARCKAGLTQAALQLHIERSRSAKGKPDIDRLVGEAILEARQKAKLSQEALGASLDRSADWVRKVETGKKSLEYFEFWEIAKVLGVSFEKLLSRIPLQDPSALH